MKNSKTGILFVCIGNMCRSPMAEGFGREFGGDSVQSWSAGTHPTGVVSEDSIRMMDEIDIDISSQRSQGLDAIPFDEIDIVVSMAMRPARDLVPPDFTGRTLDWDIPDPLGGPPDYYRSVRDEIGTRVRDLLNTLDTTK